MDNDKPNNKQPLVSFIVTYHNEPMTMLRECLDSILALTLADEEREIIIVDDGSDESPLNELLEYRDRILYVRQTNNGVSVARNRGITNANGQFIQFVDADDTIIDSGYEHVLDVVRNNEPDMVLFNFTTEEEDVDTPYLFNGPFSGSEYMQHNNLKASVCCYILKKKTLVDLRFTEGIEYGEDEQFTPQLILRAEKLYATDTFAYFYRMHDKSVTHNDSSRALAKKFKDTEHVILYLNHLSQTLPTAERLALQRRVAQLTMDYLYNIITKTHSEHQLEERLKRLEKEGLFPLPDKNYTSKYKLFGKMIKHKYGRKIMLYLLGRL